MKTINSSSFTAQHRTSLYATALFVIALVARIPAMIKHFALGPDDGVYAMSAVSVADGMAPFKDTFSSQGGYFLELISVPVRLFPDLFWAPRAISILTGCLISLCVYFLGRRFMPEHFAACAGFLCALSGTLLRTTGPITSDGVVALVSLMCIIAALRFVDSPTLFRALTLGIALGVGTQIKNVFMIPTIIFLIAITWKTPWMQRVAAGIASLVVFTLPFVVYGPQKVWDQSFVYHMEKSDPRSVSANMSKILTTISSFDTAFFIVSIFLIVLGLATLIRKGFSRKAFAHFFNRETRTFPIRYLTVFYFAPAVLLMVAQTPLFKNHLAIIMPVGYLVLFFFLATFLSRVTATMTARARTTTFTALAIVSIIIGISSYLATITSSTFQPRTGHSQALTLLEPLNKDSLVLTDDPGLVWIAGLKVPRLTTDVSRYRFSSKTDSITLTSASFSKLVNEPHVCAAVQSPIQKSELMKIESWVPKSWDKYAVGKYTLWINPSNSCQK